MPTNNLKAKNKKTGEVEDFEKYNNKNGDYFYNIKYHLYFTVKYFNETYEVVEEKEEECDICNTKYKAVSEYSTCPDCYSHCSDPSYHRGKACDGSC